MSQSPAKSEASAPAGDIPASDRPLTPEAARALAEAEARRQQRSQAVEKNGQKEVGGRDGPDPTRFGDWEKGGLASDF
ncbi:MAG: DUF1674 domain-containing protein [Hyphomicrobium sp.]